MKSRYCLFIRERSDEEWHEYIFRFRDEAHVFYKELRKRMRYLSPEFKIIREFYDEPEDFDIYVLIRVKNNMRKIK